MSSDTETAGYYRLHVFCCTNQRADPSQISCGREGIADMRAYLKDRVKALGLPSVRINSAGCLGRCAEGPVMVVYPDGIWYRYQTHADLDRILEEHLGGGRPVAALRLTDQRR